MIRIASKQRLHQSSAAVSTGKKVKGRKHHIVTDMMWRLLAVVVHAANIYDPVEGGAVFETALKKYPGIKGGEARGMVKSLKLL
ncbi:MAG: hypothetical protein LBU86_07110 [Oscillospiraceae bacterium]|nr:hypothetical protein [Oscillospiraceae bacterium]